MAHLAQIQDRMRAEINAIELPRTPDDPDWIPPGSFMEARAKLYCRLLELKIAILGEWMRVFGAEE